MKTLATRLMALALVGLGMSMAGGVSAVAASTGTPKITVRIVTKLPYYLSMSKVYWVTVRVAPALPREAVDIDIVDGVALSGGWTHNGVYRGDVAGWPGTAGTWHIQAVVVVPSAPTHILARSNILVVDMGGAPPVANPRVHMTASRVHLWVGQTLTFVARYIDPAHIIPQYRSQDIWPTNVPPGWSLDTGKGELAGVNAWTCQHSVHCAFRVMDRTPGTVVYHAATAQGGPESNRITVTWTKRPTAKAGNA